MKTGSTSEKVAVVKYDGTSNAFRKAIELCGGFEGLKPDHKILLKPNILWGGTKKLPPFGVVTTSAVVGNLLQLLRDQGCKDVTIGEGTIPNRELRSSTNKGYEWSGIGKVAKRYGARLVDFNSGPFEEVQIEKIKAKISRWALESDFLINLPVLKAHRQTKVSLGMKNLKGCLALESKKNFHRHDLPRLIALLNTKIKTSLTIIDGIYAMEQGPDFLGTSYRTNLLIAGRDILSCDIVGAAAIGIKAEEVDYLREFSSLTGQSLSLDAIEVKGETLKGITRPLKWHLSVDDVFHRSGIQGITVQHGDTDLSCCSGCAAILSAFCGVFCKDNPGMALDGVEICMGERSRPKKESKKVFLLGNCAIAANKEFKDGIKIKGCPPPILDTVTSIVVKSLPKTRVATILMSRLVKNIGIKMGIYDEAFPAFGVHKPPEFDRSHF
jgi:uncharacterized protein (DUF362 family)